MDNVISLLCWIRGRSIHPLVIDIEGRKMVAHLKEAIKEKKPDAFENIDTDKFSLWRVCGFSPLL
jgi:hypothetical protein